jgi:hypothetical protein
VAAVLPIVTLTLLVSVSLTVCLLRTRREYLRRLERRAVLNDQRRQAEQRLQQLTHAALQHMLDVARLDGR